MEDLVTNKQTVTPCVCVLLLFLWHSPQRIRTAFTLRNHWSTTQTQYKLEEKNSFLLMLVSCTLQFVHTGFYKCNVPYASLASLQG